ncbi:MAG: OmpH family outer membrane protein [Vampirovibrionales bacterium]
MSRVMSVALVALVAGCISVTQAFAQTIGYIDFPMVRSKFGAFQAYVQEARLKQADLAKLEADLNRQLEETRKNNANNPLALKQMQENLGKTFQAKMQEFQSWADTRENAFQTQLQNSIDGVRKAKLVDVVLDKGMVFSGGVDLTQEVIMTLNNSTPAPAVMKPAVAPVAPKK